MDLGRDSASRQDRLPVKVLRADLDALATPVRQSSFEDVESAVERIVASAPPLSDSQVRRLASLFGGAA